jgi:hypothetical protein
LAIAAFLIAAISKQIGKARTLPLAARPEFSSGNVGELEVSLQLTDRAELPIIGLSSGDDFCAGRNAAAWRCSDAITQ